MLVRSVGRLESRRAVAQVEMLPGAVLALRMRGVLTPPVLAHFAAQASESHSAGAKAFLLDYRASVLVASDTELGAMVRATPLGSPVRLLPGAFVSTEAFGETLREHAIRMAEAGFVRRAFFNEDDAHRWALRRARSQRGP